MPELRRARPLLGTLVEIAIRDGQPREARLAAMEAAFSAITRVHALMSFQEPTSDLARLNREALKAPQYVDPWIWAVLDFSRQLACESGGAFDPSVGARLQALNLLPGTPPPCFADFRALELHSDHRVSYRAALSIDLGGVAKGFAVDRAVDALRAAGLREVLVNAGGDLYALGRWRLAIRHPGDARRAQPLELCDAALATSAAYGSRHGTGVDARSALIDPRSARPWLATDSVSVIAPSAMSADALTKVALFAPAALAQRLLHRHGARALRLRAAEASLEGTA